MKKYLVTTFSILVIILLGMYIYKWIEVKEEEKYLNSYLIETNTINLEMTDLNEITSVLSETPSYYFLYISYNQNKSIYEFEKKLKPIIDEYNLHNSFYYLNITNIKNKDYKEKISKSLNIDKKIFEKIPVILYFENGKFEGKAIYTPKDFNEYLKTIKK